MQSCKAIGHIDRLTLDLHLMTILHDAFLLAAAFPVKFLSTFICLPALLRTRLTGLPPHPLLPSMVALTQTILLRSDLHRIPRHPAADLRSAPLRWQASTGACASNARGAARKLQLVANFSTPATRPQARAAAGRSAAVSEKVAVVLVDHGSRRPEANAMLEIFADLYRCLYTCLGSQADCSLACMHGVAWTYAGCCRGSP